MKYKCITGGPISENCYLLIDEKTNQAAVVDPGFLNDALLNEILMMYESVTCKVHEAFKDGETFQIGEVPVTVLHTPGHTAGGVSYITPDAVFTGDTLMGYSVGRCDLPTGNSAELRESLKKLAALSGNPDICGGHGPVTTLEDEKRRNPYL